MSDGTDKAAPGLAGVAGLFDDAESLLRAAERVRDAGFRRWDCHTPFPVHGLERAMGTRPSPVPSLAIAAGFAGLAAAVLLTGGISALVYPLHVGGKSLFSWPAFVPVWFELFVLFAALAALGSLLLLGRLGRWSSPLHDAGVMKEITSRRFALVMDAGDPAFSEASARALLEAAGCRDIRPLAEGGPAAAPPPVEDAPAAGMKPIPARILSLLRRVEPRWSPGLFKAAVGGAVAAAFLVPLALVATPFLEFFNDMAAQPKGRAQMTYGRTFDEAGDGWEVERPPAEGTLPRGIVPYPFADAGNSIEDARAVGQRWTNPLPYTMENLKRGRKVFNVFCAACHGSRGEGDGPVIGPGRFPAPPSLNAEQARGLSDGAVYHIISRGTGKMPSYALMIDPGERWQAAMYVRALQRAMNPRPEDLEGEER